LSGLPEVDHAYLNKPEWMRQFSMVSICESCIKGSKGAVQEAALYFNKTGYDIAQIQQPIHFWWGTEDRAVPVVHPKAIEEKAPNATVYYKSGEGHLSIYIRYFEEVLQTIARQ
jgi:pimeloyl-ACP methyl ester carboxylesterase